MNVFDIILFYFKLLQIFYYKVKTEIHPFKKADIFSLL